jgi:hypothetical protein
VWTVPKNRMSGACIRTGIEDSSDDLEDTAEIAIPVGMTGDVKYQANALIGSAILKIVPFLPGTLLLRYLMVPP